MTSGNDTAGGVSPLLTCKGGCIRDVHGNTIQKPHKRSPKMYMFFSNMGLVG